MDTPTMMNISFAFKPGTPPSDVAAALRFQAGLLEGMSGKEAASRENTDAAPAVKKAKAKAAPVEPEADIDEDDDFTPKKVNVSKAAKAKAASFDEDDGGETTAVDEDEESFEEAPPAKKAKAKKLTQDDVNDACKKRASGGRRPEVLAILKKQFKVASISDLKPEQYAQVITAMAEDEE